MRGLRSSEIQERRNSNEILRPEKIKGIGAISQLIFRV